MIRVRNRSKNPVSFALKAHPDVPILIPPGAEADVPDDLLDRCPALVLAGKVEDKPEKEEMSLADLKAEIRDSEDMIWVAEQLEDPRKSVREAAEKRLEKLTESDG